MCTYCNIGDGQIDKRCHFRRPVLTRLSPATTFSAVQFYDRLGDLPSRVFARQLKVLTRQINYKGNAHWYLTMKNYLIRGSLCARNTIYVLSGLWYEHLLQIVNLPFFHIAHIILIRPTETAEECHTVVILFLKGGILSHISYALDSEAECPFFSVPILDMSHFYCRSNVGKKYILGSIFR